MLMYSSGLNFLEVPKSIIFIFAKGFPPSSKIFSGFKSLYLINYFLKITDGQCFEDGNN